MPQAEVPLEHPVHPGAHQEPTDRQAPGGAPLSPAQRPAQGQKPRPRRRHCACALPAGSRTADVTRQRQRTRPIGVRRRLHGNSAALPVGKGGNALRARLRAPRRRRSFTARCSRIPPLRFHPWNTTRRSEPLRFPWNLISLGLHSTGRPATQPEGLPLCAGESSGRSPHRSGRFLPHSTQLCRTLPASPRLRPRRPPLSQSEHVFCPLQPMASLPAHQRRSLIGGGGR